MLARDQDGLLEATLALIHGTGPAPRPIDQSSWATWCGMDLVHDAARFQRAAFASGLTAALASLATRADLPLPTAWQAYAEEQVDAVAQRQRRFRALLPEVLHTLDQAGVAALPVKGLVVADSVWPDPSWRPMSDLDVVVDPADRARAGEALVQSGLRRWASAAWEDTYLAWGDGTAGRIDGESPQHNGKVEVHPGWVERLHNYLVSDGGVLLAHARPGVVLGAPALTLDPAARALQVVGHLSACVIRAEVRPLNVLDAVLCLQALAQQETMNGDGASFARLAARIDPRLVSPGLWLVDLYKPGLCKKAGAAPLGGESWATLPGGRRALQGIHRSTVLRDPTRRRNLRWRQSFATTPSERMSVLRQWLVPPPAERGPGGAGPLWRLQADRVGRAAAGARGQAARRLRVRR